MTTNTATTTTTKDTIQRYFDRLQQRGDWQGLFADDVVFTSRTSSGRQLRGRDAFVQGAGGFYRMILDAEMRDLIVDGDKACALTHYRLQPPNGGAVFESDVAEVFTVRDGAIDSFTIYFDSAPYPK
jgi:ketosteroid isomerase-like protein